MVNRDDNQCASSSLAWAPLSSASAAPSTCIAYIQSPERNSIANIRWNESEKFPILHMKYIFCYISKYIFNFYYSFIKMMKIYRNYVFLDITILWRCMISKKINWIHFIELVHCVLLNTLFWYNFFWENRRSNFSSADTIYFLWITDCSIN